MWRSFQKLKQTLGISFWRQRNVSCRPWKGQFRISGPRADGNGVKTEQEEKQRGQSRPHFQEWQYERSRAVGAARC